MKFLAICLLFALSVCAEDSFPVGTSSLSKGLVAGWRLEESSGLRYDVSSFGNNLSSTNNVSSTAGKVGNCAKFTAASSQFLNITDKASLSFANHSFEITGWFLRNPPTAANGMILTKWNTGDMEYMLFDNNGSTFAWLVEASNGASSPRVDSSGTLATNTWFFFDVYFDAASNTIGVSRNNGAFTIGAAAGSRDGGARFELGARQQDGNYFNGQIDEVYIWDRVLSRVERDAVYALGVGSHYPWYSNPIRTQLVATDGQVSRAHFRWQNQGILSFNGWTYNFYMNSTVGEAVNSFNITNGVWNPTSVVVGSAHVADENHNYLSANVDSSGYMYAFYGCHDSPLYYQKTTNANSAAIWSGETTITTNASYPCVMVDQADFVYCSYRGPNTRYYQFQKSEDHGITWSSPTMLVDTGNDTIFVYCQAAMDKSSPQNAIHTMWYKHAASGLPSDAHNIYYAKSTDGGTNWIKADGTPISIPADFSALDLVYTGTNINSCGIGITTNNSPVLLWPRSNDGLVYTDTTLWAATYSGGAWAVQQLPGDHYWWGGVIAVAANNHWFVFASQLQGSRREIVQLVSRDSGASWNSSNVTSGSGIDQLNPVCHCQPAGDVIDLSWDASGTVLYKRIGTQ